MKRSVLVFGFVVASACGESPGSSWLVDHPRVLGARIDADHTTWLVAGAKPRIGWAFATCAAPEGNFAEPRCATNVIAAGRGTSDAGDAVAMVTGALAPRTLVLATFCEESDATLDPRSFTGSCASGTEALLASVVSGPDDNRAPSIPDDAIASAGPCAGPLTFRFDEAMRDPGESLLLAHFVGGGTLDRTYSTFEPNEAAPKVVSIDWTPPEGASDVKVWFVLRDGRGGTAFVTKTLCRKEP